MKAIPVIGIAAFALAACEAQETTAGNETETTVLQDETGTDPATTDLNLDAGASEVDQAINQTDAQSNLGNAVE